MTHMFEIPISCASSKIYIFFILVQEAFHEAA